jgi:hypothetical protein
MTCNTCRNYRPCGSLTGRCVRTSERMMHNEWCTSHEAAPVESLADWIASGGRITVHPPGPGSSAWDACKVQSRQSRRTEKHGMVPINEAEVIR